MLQRVLAFSLLAAVALPAAAQEGAAGDRKRGSYVVKHATATDLAGILSKHFKGAAEIQAGPQDTGNVLLINAPSAVYDEILKAVEQFDRRPKLVVVDVILIELPAKKSDDQDKGIDDRDFNGTLEQVSKRLDAMMRKGQVSGLKRIRISAVEGQFSSAMVGENKPFTAGASVSATGIVQKQIYYRNLGTQLKVRPLFAADGFITLELNIEDSRSRDSDTAIIAADQKGKSIPAAEFIQTSLTGKIIVASGMAVRAKEVKVVSKGGQEETLIVVGARVADPEIKSK